MAKTAPVAIPVTMLPADALALADCLTLSVPTKTVTVEPSTLRYFDVPPSALQYPVIGKAQAADTHPALAPAVPAYNRKARDLNVAATRIRGANRWASYLNSAFALLADKNPDAATRAVALGLMSPKDAE